jgi:2-polyprenyl-3-methyl-5-hydroxy-6-metoxy-1,4-benzoquinol methylase
VACNYCGCREADIIADRTRFEANTVLQCRRCGLVYLPINGDREAVESFYAGEYRRMPNRPVRTPEELHDLEVTRRDAASRLEFIAGHIDIRGKKVLELGSASGNLLEELAGAGAAEVTGIELDADLARFLSGRGLNVVTRPVEESGFRDEFDAVVAFHTMEHVYDPMAAFRAVQAALKPGGLFLGEVPNQDDWRIKIFDDAVVKRFHYEPSHYYYYSPATLKEYLATAGFGEIELTTVERYNSLAQLRNILTGAKDKAGIEATLTRHLFPRDRGDEVRLANPDDAVESQFNRIFARGVNAELMGNCLRWAARKNTVSQDGNQ